MVLFVVSGSDSELGIIGMHSVEFKLSHEGGDVLSMDLKSPRPEITFPNETGLGILKTSMVFVIDVLSSYSKVETSDVVPERHNSGSSNNGPKLEPSFRVNVVQSEIRVTLEGSPDGETVRSVFLLEYGESVDDIRSLKGHLVKNSLLPVVVFSIRDSLFHSEEFIVVFSKSTGSPFTKPLSSVLPVVSPKGDQIKHL